MGESDWHRWWESRVQTKHMDVQTKHMELPATPDQLTDVGERVLNWYSREMLC